MGEFLLALLLLLTGPAVAFEVPEGFRGIKWGTTIAEVGAQFTLIEDSTRGTKYYARKDDRLKIGEADVIRILYAFYRDRFFYVSVRFANLANFRPIKETLFAAYGPGNRPNQYIERYFWHSATVDIILDYSEVSTRGSIGYFYSPIATEKEADEKTRARDAKKDL